MNKQASFNRKLGYGIAIIVLLAPLYYLSHPATRTNGGGVLSQMKQENGLSQASLGKIDPASETMKLATLGLRGVAVNLLWNKANEYKKKEDWTNLTATLEQLARLQPNIISFWKFQSWNVSYNVSVQFDDYRDRYYYVRRGIEFLEQGVEKNKENRQVPQLLWDLGWFVGHKIGRADEKVQYRQLFKNDDEYHGDDPPPGSDLRDNWLVSKQEYINAIDAVDVREKSLGKKSEKIFYSSPAKSQMSYAEAIETEGEFKKGQAAWKTAASDWQSFGDLPIQHSTGRTLYLGREDELAVVVEELEQQLEALDPGLRERMIEERRAKLTDEQRVALETEPAERTEGQWQIVPIAEAAIEVNDLQFVQQLTKEKPELRKQAGILLQELAEKQTDLIYTTRYKTDANYDYWELRAEFEQTDTAVEARRKMYEGKQAFEDKQDTVLSKKLYDEGFAKWDELLDTFPELMNPDDVTGDDIMVFIIDYRKMLNAKGDEIADDFPLWDVIINFDAEQEFTEEVERRRLRMREAQGQSTEESSDEQPEESPEAEESTKETTEESELETEESTVEAGDIGGGDAPAGGAEETTEPSDESKQESSPAATDEE